MIMLKSVWVTKSWRKTSKLCTLPTLAEVDGDRNNNMDFLRFAAALAVIVHHSFTLRAVSDPFAVVLGKSLGAVALDVFFALSGFLVAKSLVKTESLSQFAIARGARLFPALITVNIMTVICGALLWTSESWRGYMQSSQWVEYLVVNSTAISNRWHLPGVFADNPANSMVNGSLWTLPVEVRMYGLVAMSGAVALVLSRWCQRHKFVKKVLLSVTASIAIALSLGLWDRLQIGYGPWLHSRGAVTLMGVFAIGMMCEVCRRFIVLDGRVVVGLLMLAVATRSTSAEYLTYACAVVYSTLWLSYTHRLDARGFSGRIGDLSYGTYLIGWPVQQWLYSRWPDMSPSMNTLYAIPVVLILAWMSWTLVEGPSLKLKTKVLDRIRKDRPSE